MRPEILEPYKGNIFIETGMGGGSGIWHALKLGFQKIYSIEILADNFLRCVKKYNDNPKVSLIYGDSKIEFKKLLKQIKEPATIWLDAHTGEDTSLIEELNALLEHPIKNHIILIDDLSTFKNWDLELNKVIIKLKKINSNYQIKFIGPDDHPNNILVATIK